MIERRDEEVSAAQHTLEMPQKVQAGVRMWEVLVRRPSSRDELELRRDRAREGDEDEPAPERGLARRTRVGSRADSHICGAELRRAKHDSCSGHDNP
jgi:hypothetical protein